MDFDFYFTSLFIKTFAAVAIKQIKKAIFGLGLGILQKNIRMIADKVLTQTLLNMPTMI
jgi:hypothetical protein